MYNFLYKNTRLTTYKLQRECKNMEEPKEIRYDKVDPEEIIIKLKEVLAFIQNKKKEGKI